MIASITILLLFQLIGETISLVFSLPVPGPVIGMALLFLALSLRGGPTDSMRNTAQSLLQNLSLLFVPAGVGIMLHFHRLADEWLSISLAILISTLATIAVTALVLKLLMGGKLHNKNEEPHS